MQEQTVIICTRKKKNLNSISRVVSNHFIHKLNQLLLCHEKGFPTNLIRVVGTLKLYQKEKYSESPESLSSRLKAVHLTTGDTL